MDTFIHSRFAHSQVLISKRTCSFTVRVTTTGGLEALAEPNISTATRPIHLKATVARQRASALVYRKNSVG